MWEKDFYFNMKFKHYDKKSNFKHSFATARKQQET